MLGQIKLSVSLVLHSEDCAVPSSPAFASSVAMPHARAWIGCQTLRSKRGRIAVARKNRGFFCSSANPRDTDPCGREAQAHDSTSNPRSLLLPQSVGADLSHQDQCRAPCYQPAVVLPPNLVAFLCYMPMRLARCRTAGHQCFRLLHESILYFHARGYDQGCFLVSYVPIQLALQRVIGCS